MERFFVSKQVVKDTCLITGDEHHHLKNVLRKKENSLVEVIDSENRLFKGIIKEIGSKETLICALQVLPSREPDIFF